MNLRTIWEFAIAEMRTCSRLARTWVFVCLALAIGLTMYVLEVNDNSWLNPTPPTGWVHGNIASRYTINNVADGFGVLFIVGVVILCFDVRARDTQNRINDVIDSKPANNLEVVCGRIGGIFLLLLVPMLVFVTFLTGYEIISICVGAPNRLGLLPSTIVSRIVFGVIPGLLFFGALSVFLATLVRNRFLVATLAFGLLISLTFFYDGVPVRIQEGLALSTNSTQLHSDLAPVFLTSTVLVNRLTVLSMSIGLLVFAASLLPRTQPRRIVFTTGATVCCLVGTLCFFGLIFSLLDSDRRRYEYIKQHEEYLTETTTDIEHIFGNVDLWPGRTVALDLTLIVNPSETSSTDEMIFSLNPGYRIQKISIDGREFTNYKFEYGIIKISNSDLPDRVRQLSIQARGRPDDEFAYLDQARNYGNITSPWIPFLGTQNSILHSQFVALMPDTKWYPTPGTTLNEDLLESKQRDLYTFDLSVSVPKKWKVAMPGNRQATINNNRVTYRFKTIAPVPEIALIASNFEQRTTTIEGIRFEILFSQKHRRNLDILAPYTDQIESWVSERIKNARELSFEYPYEVFYVVEVPSTLRIYGGGWRMDSVLHPPGMMLIRETTFPTASFDTVVRKQEKEHSGIDNFVLNKLINYIEDDVQGGNPFAGFSRNFVNHQSSPTGRGSTALDYLMELLATHLIMQRDSLFLPSFWEFGMRSELGSDRVSSRNIRHINRATQLRASIAWSPSTWEELERTPLFNLAYQSKPILSHRVLLTKGYSIAVSLIEFYGRERVAKFMSDLVNAHLGTTYTFNDFRKIAATNNINLSEWGQHLLDSNTLPAYVVAKPQIQLLESLEPKQFQTTFLLHNAEQVSGLVRILWSSEPNVNLERHLGHISTSEEILVTGHQTLQVAIQSTEKLTGLWVEPILALNRSTIVVQLPELEEADVSSAPIQPFLSIVNWTPSNSSEIVVDDLDPGFRIVEQTKEKKFSIKVPLYKAIPIFETEFDLGLPVRKYPIKGEWSREYNLESFGRYRHSHTRIAKGNQNTYASFVANLPFTGAWKLDFFVPNQALQPQFIESSSTTMGVTLYDESFSHRLPTASSSDEYYRLEIRDRNSNRLEKFDIGNAQEGWNEVGIFELSSTNVEMLLSDFAGHEDIMVYADAIRWTPVESD